MAFSANTKVLQGSSYLFQKANCGMQLAGSLGIEHTSTTGPWSWNSLMIMISGEELDDYSVRQNCDRKIEWWGSSIGVQ